MRLKWTSIKGLALLLTIASFLAIASTAQASEFKLEGSTFASKGISNESITGSIGGGKLLVPGLGLTIVCTSGTTLLAKVFEGGEIEAELLFSGCSVEGASACKIYPTQANAEKKTRAGEIEAAVLGKLLLKGGSHYLLLQGPTVIIGGFEISLPIAEIFYSIKICALASGQAITGATVLSLPDALTSQLNHAANTIAQATLESLFFLDQLRYGNQTAWLDGGGGSFHLSGANANRWWSGE